MKKFLLLISFLLVSFIAVNSAPAAQIVFVVDESGSMGGEHAWIQTMAANLETGLVDAGVTSNTYGIVGFGRTNSSSYGTTPAPYVNTAMAALPATGFATSLVTTGGTEDGWAAINYAFSDMGLNTGQAINVILITDEDRDNTDGNLNYNGIRDLFGANAILNSVVNWGFDSDSNSTALGVSSGGTAYVADGTGFTTATNGVASPPNDLSYDTAFSDYIQLAWATGGAAWDLNQLRAGGDVATAFTNAFIDIKVEETVIIEDNNPVPEPATMVLFGLGLLGLAGVNRRKK